MANKGTTIKAALAEWQEQNKIELSKATKVELQFRWPPIEKMDNSLSVLTNCELLSLSTNCIEKINGLANLKNLKILALGRNNIKSLSGLDSLADTLEELWISYNYIDKVKGVLGLHKLKVLYMSHNNIESWSEVVKLNTLESLQDLILKGNPLPEALGEKAWQTECINKLPKISILDGIPIIRDSDI
ncbi:dynein light chain 1, axonemal-like [Sipha flava]|uniref:Dynein axonemal light chain 1 n=1 Tax=Sipha flava TaxID=143950 RepID=A0A8B8FC50_9HEMI|nr:dynein light chain 1, axonemal-like [Sipha flava]